MELIRIFVGEENLDSSTEVDDNNAEHRQTSTNPGDFQGLNERLSYSFWVCLLFQLCSIRLAIGFSIHQILEKIAEKGYTASI